VTGQVPALDSELANLKQVISSAGLAYVSSSTEVPGLSQNVNSVYFAGGFTGNQVTALPSQLATLLATVNNPQNSITIFQVPAGTNLGFDPLFDSLRSKGTTNIFDAAAIVISLPATGYSSYQALGYGHTLNLSGSGNALIRAELALTPTQIGPVSEQLLNAGFAVTSQNYFLGSSEMVLLDLAAQTSDADTLNSQLDAIATAINSLQP
jgi:hypothetical protein